MATETQASRTKRPFSAKRAGRPSFLGRLLRPRRLLCVLVPALLVWFAPMLVAKTPLLDWAINWATGDMPGRVTVGSASLGWTSPCVLNAVDITDAQGRTLLAVDQIASEKTLWELVRAPASLGRFTVEKPELHVVVDADGSNLEEVLAPYLEGPSGDLNLGVELDVSDGVVVVEDATTDRVWEVSQVRIALNIPEDATAPIRMSLDAVTAEEERPGWLSFVAAYARWGGESRAAASQDTSEFSLDAQAFPLAALQPWLGRLHPDTHIEGWMSVKCEGQIPDANMPESFRLHGGLAAEGLQYSSGLLGTDRIEFEKIQILCELAADEQLLRCESLSVDSEVGRVSLTGTLDREDWAKGGDWATLLRQPCGLSGEIDLARLASMLPQTLHLNEESQVTSGTVQFGLQAKEMEDHHRWSGSLEIKGLEATKAGRTLTWPQPVQVGFAAWENQQGPVIESLSCQSDFLELQASGTLDKLDGSATFDLDRLTEQVGNLVNLGDLDIGGDGWATLEWRRDAEHAFKAKAEMQVQDFQLTLDEDHSLVEKTLKLALSTEGQTDFDAATQVDTATLEAQAQGDSVAIRLTEPVAGFNANTDWHMEIDLAGRLKRWQDRLTPWFSVEGWNVDGNANGFTKVNYSADRVQLAQLQVTVNDFVLTGPKSVDLHEPRVTLVIDAAQWDSNSGAIDVQGAVVSSDALAVRGDRVAFASAADPEGESAVQLAGFVEYDLAKLSEHLRPMTNNGVFFAGHKSTPIGFQGPITMAGGHAQGQIAWDWGDLYGFQVGPGVVKASLADGTVRVEPLDLILSEGRVRVTPQLEFTDQGTVLSVESGAAANSVRIRPQMCQRGLQYIAPILAGVAVAEGTFSIELDRCRMPLGDPAAGELEGRMTVHNVQIGAGPLIQRLAMVLGYSGGAQLTQESRISFRMVDGRVYHEDLEFAFPDLTVRTFGSVGLDQTLALTAEMPIPPHLLGRHAAVDTALRNQTVRLPIGGTLMNPKIDQRVLEKLSQQFIERAATNLIQDEVSKGLQRLFE